ncbi:glycosyltransferase family 2 protein [Zunongwangia atlantica]|uniref:Group 2 family glycosyltransferase n=1 Tax=Zunongwangia atlantica 22II14-10F7 TaxID=1185767 RepID=A0A1Y1SYT8_9FLAO|nr:glycosyltransferase family 2 protein [Zunongwangia atlantica]ORL43732.1 group 2 family glycosyltransferase [Zunongwangia atlantica 22II14-10F7]
MRTIAALLTVFNRKEKTLECLQRLYEQKIPDDYSMEVFMVDDGCTDGTPEAVSKDFPRVHIIKESGDLFWNRGMYRAWKAALSKKQYDFYLWLNDDTFLFDGAINTIIMDSDIKSHKSIICGTTQSLNGEKLSYGGKVMGGELITPESELQECNYMNGNFVLIPKFVYEKVGLIDPFFRHSLGDLDYSLRAAKKGIKTFVATKIIGACENHETLPKWCLAETPLFKRYRALYSPLGNSHPYYYFIYELRHFGLFVATKHFFTIHLRATFPRLWKI